MIEQRTAVTSIEIKRDGSMLVHTVREFVEDGAILQTGLQPHDIRIDPGADVAAKLALENEALALRAVPPITDGWDFVEAVAPAVHSRDVVDAFVAKRAAAGRP